MRITAAFLKLKNRLADTTGAISQEYVMTGVSAAGVVAVLVKIVSSTFFLHLVQALIATLFAKMGLTLLLK